MLGRFGKKALYIEFSSRHSIDNISCRSVIDSEHLILSSHIRKNEVLSIQIVRIIEKALTVLISNIHCDNIIVADVSLISRFWEGICIAGL